jgi:MinD-like ATPase involved in chromosome partitioning or flagellar assembly
MPRTEEVVDARPVELREGEDTVQLHLEYDSLRLSDLTAILTHVNAAYSDLASAFRVQRPMLKTRALSAHMRRVVLRPRFAPLRIVAIDTRHSIILICVGAAVVIGRLAHTATKVFKARKAMWESSKAKSEAKEADSRLREALGKGQRVFTDPRATSDASREIRKLADSIEETETIEEGRLQLDGFSWAYRKSKTERTSRP